MPKRLRHPTQLADGLRAIGRSQLERAVADLGGPDPDVGIHDARKRIKAVRALLRALRGPMGKRAYRRRNAALRDIARRLSPARDGAAMLETVDALAADDGATPALEALRRVLDARRDEGAASFEPRALAESAAAALQDQAAAVTTWPLDGGLDGEDLIAGLRRTYARGRKAMAAAEDGDAEAVHEWRKRTKDLRYGIDLIRACWKRPLKAMVKECSRLGDLLGDHHDLAVLRTTCSDLPPGTLGDRHASDGLLAQIDARSRRLLAQALPLGDRLWTERPKAFATRLQRYWQAWERAGD